MCRRGPIDLFHEKGISDHPVDSVVVDHLHDLFENEDDDLKVSLLVGEAVCTLITHVRSKIKSGAFVEAFQLK